MEKLNSNVRKNGHSLKNGKVHQVLKRQLNRLRELFRPNTGGHLHFQYESMMRSILNTKDFHPLSTVLI